MDTFTKRSGGAPANVAVGLARLERTPYFWTRLGTDSFGRGLEETLRNEGIPDRFIELDADAKTTLAFVEKDGTGDQQFTFYREHAPEARMGEGAIPGDVLSEVSWIYIGGVALTSEPARSAILDLGARGRAAGCGVFFDPNVRSELWDGKFEAIFDESLPVTDVLAATPTDLALAGFEGLDHEELAAAVHSHGPHTVFLTLGEDGTYVSTTNDSPFGRGETRHEGYAVDSVDTTGAGDAFAAGALAALSDGEPLSAVVSFANAVAAVSTTAHGAMAGLPNRKTVARFLSGRRSD